MCRKLLIAPYPMAMRAQGRDLMSVGIKVEYSAVEGTVRLRLVFGSVCGSQMTL